jgi:hypothetical protein
MILKNFEDILIPILKTWNKLDYKNIECKNKINLIIRNKKLIHNFDNDIDNCILHALNYYDNLNTFVIFGKNKNESYKYYCENFQNDYILYGIKEMEIDTSLIHKIMYQLLFARMIIKTKNDLYSYIEKEYEYLHNCKDKIINVTCLIVCKRDLKKKYPSNDTIDKDFCIYFPNTKEQITNCSGVFFCNSTLSFLKLQNFDFFLTKDMQPSKKMFLKYRSWINDNIDISNKNQFMLFSSIVLYLLGHRPMNDLDLYVHTIPEDLIEKLNEFKNNTLFNFIEFKIKNTENWPDYWNIWLDKWAEKCDAKYFEEILGNPKYHFYFLGMKIISLDCDIVRRLERNRPRAVADLLALRKRYPLKINIPSINEISYEYISIKDKTENEIKILLDKGGILNEEQKEIVVKYNTDITKFIGTIIYALHTRYRMTFTIDEIKRELNMYIDTKKRIKVLVKRVT